MTPDVDVCAYLKIGKMLPMYDNFMNDLKARFQNFPGKCPIKPGSYYSLNYTGYDENKKRIEVKRDSLPDQPLPNGVYKIHLKLFNQNDPLIYEVEWTYFIKKRLGEEDF